MCKHPKGKRRHLGAILGCYGNAECWDFSKKEVRGLNQGGGATRRCSGAARERGRDRLTMLGLNMCPASDHMP